MIAFIVFFGVTFWYTNNTHKTCFDIKKYTKWIYPTLWMTDKFVKIQMKIVVD